MSFTVVLRHVFCRPRHSFETRLPISSHALEVRKHDLGGLWWWQSLMEIAFNIFIALATLWFACRFGPEGSGLLWVLVVFLALLIAPQKVAFRLFTRRPPSMTIACEPACIPPELLHRYQQARSEFEQVIEEIDRFAVQREQDHSREGQR